ncbi:MAG: DUF4838 domain-containing protein [Clostridiales bacterium]|nr:DUF4838 domain-containing protein [Clostridiales bacterium]
MINNKELTGSVLIHPDELDSVWISEAVRLGIPRIGLHPVGGAEAHNSLRELLEQLKTPEFRKMINEAVDNGIEIEYEMHTARYLLPADKFATHPEWFRQNADGVRTPDKNCCATNKDALEFMAKRAADTVKQLYRSTHRYYFWLDDASDSACHCPSCKNYTPSEQQMLIMNALLAGIKTVDPEAKLAFLAYSDCKQPPEKVKPDDGIFLEYAPMDRDYHIAMNDPSSAKNAAQCKYPEALLKCFGKKDAKLLEYWLDNSLFSNWKKPPKAFTPDTAVIEADAAYYKELGFTDIATFACYLGADYRELHGMPDITPYAKILK